MAGLYLYSSNRLEALVEEFASITREPLRSPLQAETVIVQSLGMRRWLSLQLAQQHGIVMNVEFPFPATFAGRIFRALFPETPLIDPFAPTTLTWRVLALLPVFARAQDGEELRRFMAGERSALKTYQLAGKIAAVFDRYFAYRSELLLEWQQGRATEWQPRLWRELAAGCENTHLPALLQRFEALLNGSATPPPALPDRLCVFGISSLPPYYVNFLGALSRCVDVHYFQLAPTDQYWGEITAPKERDRLERRLSSRGLTIEDVHVEAANLLLESLGKAGRDFSRLLLSLDPAGEKELFVRNDGATLLARVQADIFDLREIGAASESASKLVVEASDRSIQVHCCHGPVRELEILHDHLLDMFERDPALAPRDILVAMPEIESYAPFIEAVFGAPESETARIPFTIADRAARSESSVADAFLRILEMHGGRFGVASVLEVLETRAVQRRFSLTEPDTEIIRGWVQRAGIRWGIDADHRAELGLPRFAQNTWRAGLDRLLLGYALSGNDEALFGGIAPLREIEGSLAVTLGHFVTFAETLFQEVRGFNQARSLAEWQRTFRHVLDSFFDDRDEAADEIRRVRRVLDDLGIAAQIAGFTTPVEFDMLRTHLAGALGESNSGIGFLAGHVTFCALKPMRSIPFKVICLLGLNDGSFPRRKAPISFDLIAQKPRFGDRALRDDDRYLFLETLLSARDTLYLSYSGLSAKDNSESPPAVLVSELLDYLDARFTLPEARLREELIVTRHRLQPFNPEYFSGGRLFSYSQENCLAAEIAAEDRIEPPSFAGQPISAPDENWFQVDLDRLVRFFVHPARFFAQQRLELRLPSEAAAVEECEPMEVEGLENYQLKDRLLSVTDWRASREVMRASGQLPPGYLGDAHFQTMRAEVEGLRARISAAIHSDSLPPASIELRLGRWSMSGTLRGLHREGFVRRRPAALTAKDRITAWLMHLTLCASGADRQPQETFLFSPEETATLSPVENADELLEELLELYGRGLREPLRFFPSTSWRFAERTLRPSTRDRQSPQQAARGVWEGNDYNVSERKDPYYEYCFRGMDDPLDAVWEELALQVYGPLIEHITSWK